MGILKKLLPVFFSIFFLILLTVPVFGWWKSNECTTDSDCDYIPNMGQFACRKEIGRNFPCECIYPPDDSYYENSNGFTNCPTNNNGGGGNGSNNCNIPDGSSYENNCDCDNDSDCPSNYYCEQSDGPDACVRNGNNGGNNSCSIPDGSSYENNCDCDNDSDCPSSYSCIQSDGPDACIRKNDGGSNQSCSIPDGSSYDNGCDCDSDSDCPTNYYCKQDSGADACIAKNNNGNGSSNGNSNCSIPDGSSSSCDCDGDSECPSNYYCEQGDGWDACLKKNSSGGNNCPIPNGSSSTCDCDSDNECPSGYYCEQGDGYDACLRKNGGNGGSNSCSIPDGSSESCDCDNDSQCPSNYYCKQVSGWDPCINKGNGGGNNGNGQVDKGKGPCSSDSDCKSGLACIKEIGKAFGYSSNVGICLDPVDSVYLVGSNPSLVRDLGSGFKLVSHSEIGRWGSNAVAACSEPALNEGVGVPHINVTFYNNYGNVMYNLHIGRITKSDGQKCTFVWESKSNQCVKYCGSSDKKPGDIIRNPPFPYPLGFENNAEGIEAILRHHKLWESPSWSVDFPTLIVGFSLVIVAVIATGWCVVTFGACFA